MIRNKIDALFVINQDAQLNRIETIAQEKGFNSILLLCTHHLFRIERLEALKIAPEVIIRTFVDFINDKEMQACDDRASRELAPLLVDNNIRKKYTSLFIDSSLRYKNELVFQQISNKYTIRTKYFHGKLGVHSDFWNSVGAVPLNRTFAAYLNQKVPVVVRKIRNITKKRSIHRIIHGDQCYLFFSGIKRINFAEDYEIRSISFSRIWWILFALLGNMGKNIFIRLVKKNLHPGCKPVLSTTIHEYVHQLDDLGIPLYVFIDGYHPSNYPRSYIDTYSNCEFIVRDMFGDRWFNKFGKKTLKGLPFITTALMKPVDIHTTHTVKKILLALNHAGDWTALINRSDTDLLVESFSDMAEYFPNLNFIIRPHPTMATPEHEGTSSLKRIIQYVFSRKIKNLEVSKYTLEDDIKRGDLFISEYSQVLIDAFHAGKLGIIANLTGRRSLMKDYEELGFIATNSQESLKETIKKICENPFGTAQQQNQAAINYNNLLIKEGYCINN